MRSPWRILGCVVLGSLFLIAQTADILRGKVVSSIAASQPAALTGLPDFKVLARDNPSKYGFQSADDIVQAVLGAGPIDGPIASFLVPVDRLRNYTQATSPITLLTGGDKVIYPVLSASAVRSSMIVDKLAAGWKAAAFGGGELVRKIVDQRSRVSPQSTTLLVQVAVPSALLFGELRGSQLFLTPLTDQPDLNLRAGVSEPAAQVFMKLVTAAKAYNALPQ